MKMNNLRPHGAERPRTEGARARSIITVPLLCQAYGLPQPVPEFRFHASRLWRLDFAWPSVCVTIREGHKCSGKTCRMSPMVALEIEGGVFTQGRHSRGAGMVKDMEKYNAAVLLGWKVLRCTPRDVESGSIAALLKQVLSDAERAV